MTMSVRTAAKIEPNVKKYLTGEPRKVILWCHES